MEGIFWRYDMGERSDMATGDMGARVRRVMGGSGEIEKGGIGGAYAGVRPAKYVMRYTT